ncbi:extracellular matrix organizing protein FRAS1-like [Protopterus annectens]|uniref:extracellular matrix organizing protein FRAS1-like n=1 Tax=Protopterus annectens TaxID=7888 RepID=UPI001CFB352D|nr:extracellular matrix organizing protein FRAS1-like [Protopterus annectens]
MRYLCSFNNYYLSYCVLQNGTTWKPDSCQDCSCSNDIVFCKATQCHNPHCEFSKGEVLRILPNKCCPECTSRLQGHCQHEGQTYGHDTVWAESKCTVCSCSYGKVVCIPRACPSIECGRGEMTYIPAGECCPKCLRTGASCFSEGQLYKDGEEWQLDLCSKCICNNGDVQCYAAECETLFCNKNENVSLLPGKCCPECVPSSCLLDGTEYKHSQQWKKDNCTTCKCDQGKVKCYTEICKPITCEKGQKNVKHNWQCCDSCQATKGNCLHEGSVKYHGEMWNSADCEFCACERGQVNCQRAECSKVTCPRGEELVHLPGKCCPECVSLTSYCVYSSQSKANGEKFKEGLCKDCECHASQLFCYRRLCPPCPLGTLTVKNGECCPECRQDQCHSDCLTCSQSPDHCDFCRDPNKLIQNGKCVPVCGPGFYNHGRDCRVCKEGCATCKNGMECLSCKDSLLLKYGQCVPSCGNGFYPHQHSCAACHAICLSCTGPTERDCQLCKDPSHVKKSGLCVVDCGRGFYVNNGSCYACDQSCETCYLDSPMCLSCPLGRVLHNGKCISHCPNGYYKSASEKCKACHSSCATCSSSAALQCITCSDGLLLQHGQCLSACGMGFYPDRGVCTACHKSCRTCVGPESENCILCLNPEEVLQLTHEEDGHYYGVCQSQCKSGFYVDHSQVCQECSSTCSSCIGNTPLDCTACLSPRSLYKGQCLHKCPGGFFNKDNSCISCHPSCKECSGSSESDCTSCHPHVLLLDGSCRTSCKEGQYLNLVGFCVDCSSECQRCVADLRSNDHICLWCKKPHFFLLGNSCIPECPAGYYNANGVCEKCHASCQNCNGGSPFACTSCKSSLVLAQNGMCVSRCSPGFYLDSSHKVCQPCNSRCLTCESATVCTSCRDPSRVLLFGECLYEVCAQQYYLDYATRSCKECDWSCNACSGPLGTDCLQCMDGYVLQEGTCTEQCSAGFYKKEDKCFRCDLPCVECMDDGHCTLCQVPYFLQGTACTRDCSTGYFADHSTQQCVVCPERCLGCSSTTYCKICDNNTFQKDGLCIPDCDLGFYANTETRKCDGKNFGTSSPLNPGELAARNNGMSNVQQTEDVLTFNERGSNSSSSNMNIPELPLFSPNTGPNLAYGQKSEGGYKTIKLSHLRLFQSKLGKKEKLGFGFIPSHRASLTNSILQEKCYTRKMNLHYLLKDVNVQQGLRKSSVYNPPLHYTHKVLEKAFNSYAPVILLNGSLIVEVGGRKILDFSLMTVLDEDSRNPGFQFYVVSPPDNGQLVKVIKGVELQLAKDSTFTEEDLREHRVQFVHNREKSRNGYFTLRVSDQQFLSQPERIDIQAVSLKAPVVLTNSILLVSKSEYGAVTNSLLNIHDDDNPEDVEIVVLGSPKHGRLVILPAETKAKQFHLDVIRSGQLYYVHDGSNSKQDRILLQIGDGNNFQNIIFQISILQQDDRIPHLTDNSVVWIPEGGMLQITNNMLQALDGHSGDSEIIYTVIKDRPRFGEVIVLAPMPADSPADDWQHLPDGRAATPTTSFTQQDINDGIVWYKHHGLGSQRDSFKFQVSSASSPGLQSDVHTVQIGIIPVKQGAPQLSPASSSLQMSAPEDSLTVILPSHLSFVDAKSEPDKVVYNITTPLPPNQGTIEHVDRPFSKVMHFTQADVNQRKIVYRPPTAPPHLQEIYSFSFMGPLLLVSETEGRDFIFELTEAPHHGVLMQSNYDTQTQIKEGDTFQYVHVIQNAVEYYQSGSVASHDSMIFLVTDTVTGASSSLKVAVAIKEDEGPKLEPGCSLIVTVPEKGSAIISRTNLAYVDDRSPDTEIRIHLISLPMYGVLTKSDSGQVFEQLSQSSAFTMEDINKKKIRYSTSVETGNQPVTDIFHFNVYDEDNNQLSNQMFTITITSVQNRPPHVTLNEQLTVEEDGKVMLSSENFQITDPDTPKSDLLVMISSDPKYGFLEKTKSGLGGSFGYGSAVAFFSIQDVTENKVYFIQTVFDSSETLYDSFTFFVTDGYSRSEEFNISIKLQQKTAEPPKVLALRVRVEESSGVVIKNTSLSVYDPDTAELDLQFTVTRNPGYGQLRKRRFYSEPLENGRILSVGSTFTFQDVLDELIVFTPSVAHMQSDEMHFSVTDGTYTESGKIEFDIELQKNESPRLAVNRGLQLTAGSVSQITEQHLKATDIDSEDLKLRYIMIKDPTVGHLQMNMNSNHDHISVKGPIKSFSQADISKGHVEYHHKKGEPGGSFSFKFDVVDTEENKLLDQSFYINVLEDRLPPTIIANKGLVLDENSIKKITTLQLSVTDQDSEPSELVFTITKQPELGHLELASLPGKRIISFTQADLASRNVQYIHMNEEEKHSDQFTFKVSDGVNEVVQTFYITIKPVDDSLPVVQIPGMRVQEGVRKTITEFELKALDADTEAESVTFTIVQQPRHGAIERTNNGQQYRPTSTFTMDDIYQNRISYKHDGSNSLKDRFTFTVADGTNSFYIVEDGGKEIVTAAPQKFRIDILPVDDGTPRIVTNLGLQWLEYMDGKAANLISRKELLTVDPDTEDKQLVYEITTGPKYGYLENKLKPATVVSTFTQEEVNLGLIYYVLREDNVLETKDTFQFLVKDSKPNIVTDNVFHIQWSLISFEYSSFNVSEKAGSVSVTVKRTGNLNQYAIVLCRSEQGTATSSAAISSRPGQQDYLEYAGQVQFDEREDTKSCTIVINDDDVYEGMESLTVELSMPAYALLGEVTKATVFINDSEDEPTLQFDKKIYHISENAGLLLAPIERKGDTSSTVSIICYTSSRSATGSSLFALESGSDFKSRAKTSESRIVLGPGVTMSTCDVQLIDDSEYEKDEDFELYLTDSSDNARIGSIASARVVIDGPNDVSIVFLSNSSFTFSEDSGTVNIPVLRDGSDLSLPTAVWCGTRPSDPPSASPGIDYVPSSMEVVFQPGKMEAVCTLTILDDTQTPVVEGSETFVIFLSSSQGAELAEPFQATVIINDTFQDVPSMQFGKDTYTVKEKDGLVDIPVVRTGDLTFESSVRCYTRALTAGVMEDFEERRNSDEFRITFLKAEKVKNCTVLIREDSVFEPEEQLQVYLSNPLGNHWAGAKVGRIDMVTLIITNDEDAPTIEFEEAAYEVREPPGPDSVAVLNIKVIRKGDQNRTSKVRCSTRDGSAQSGVDYNPKSRVLKFSPGVDHITFKVEILSSEDTEWHESFYVVLGPDDPVEALLGTITTATVTILDRQTAGSLILPAPPIVASLTDYDHIEEVTKDGHTKLPSPGYPLVCVTACDPHFPKYSVMKEHCEEAGINRSTIQFSWEVAAPTDASGARSPFETITDSTPFTSVDHMVLDSIYFSRRFHVRCIAKVVDNSGRVGTPLRSNIVTIGTENAICHTPVAAGTARGFQAQSFIAALKYLDVKHKEHPNRIHISVQIPHQDGMLPLVSTLPLHNLHFLLSESIYRQQHVCSNLVTIKDLKGISDSGFLDHLPYDRISLGPGYDRPYQFDPAVREKKTIQLYRHLNLKSCIWTFDAFYDMTELIDICGGSFTADFQVRDSAQSFLTVQVPLYVSYIYVTAPRGWASMEHHTEMEFSFFYDTVLWRTGIQTESVLSARLQVIRIYIREDGRLVIEFKTHAKFRGLFVMEHHTLPGQHSVIVAPDHLGGIEFDLQLLWSAQSFDSPYQLWRATSSYNRKDYSGEYTFFLIPCTVQPTQSFVDPGDKPLACTAHAPERFLVPIAFQQTNRPVPVVYSLNTEFQLCNNDKMFLMDPSTIEMTLAEMDYKGAFSRGQTLYGRVLWNPEQDLNSAYKLQLEKVYLCTGRDGHVPFFDPTGTIYNEGPQFGCIQPNKHLKYRFLLLDRNLPEVTDKYFHDVPFDAHFASELPEFQSMTNMPGLDGFIMKVDALYKVEAGHQWYLQVIYIIGPESIAGPRVQRSVTHQLSRIRRDLVDKNGRLVLDDSLIYDNDGDKVKNGTNMKSLRLEVEAASSEAQSEASVGGAAAAVVLLLFILFGACFLARKCKKQKKKKPTKDVLEEYPLNTKVDISKKNIDRVEKNVYKQHYTIRNINVLDKNESSYRGIKVKQVNLEVKLHNNFNDGTEV